LGILVGKPGRRRRVAEAAVDFEEPALDAAHLLLLVARAAGRRRGRRRQVGDAAVDLVELAFDAPHLLLVFEAAARGRRRRFGKTAADLVEAAFDALDALIVLGVALGRRRLGDTADDAGKARFEAAHALVFRHGGRRGDLRLRLVDAAFEDFERAVELAGTGARLGVAGKQTVQPVAERIELAAAVLVLGRRPAQAVGHGGDALVERADRLADLLVARIGPRRVAAAGCADAGTQALDGRAGGLVGIVEF